jgi:hypothetical protein
MERRRIVQIIPVQGWNALYAIRPDRNNGDPVCVCPLACWALVQQGKDRYVVGLDSTLSFCDQGDNFLGYAPPGKIAKSWRDEALAFLATSARQSRPPA